MKQFLLLLRTDYDRKISDEIRAREDELMLKWVEQLCITGHFVSGELFQPELRLAQPGDVSEATVTTDLKDQPSAFLIVGAQNIDQAKDFAQTCPLLGLSIKRVEVRPLLKNE